MGHLWFAPSGAGRASPRARRHRGRPDVRDLDDQAVRDPGYRRDVEGPTAAVTHPRPGPIGGGPCPTIRAAACRGGRCRSLLLAMVASCVVVTLSAGPAQAQPVGTVKNVALGVAPPQSVAVGADGSLWIAAQGDGTIRHMSTAGVVSNLTVVAPLQPGAVAVGADGSLWFTDLSSSTIGRVTPAGVLSTYIDPAISGPGRDHDRVRRLPLVHQHEIELDRAPLPRGNRGHLHRQQHLPADRHHQRARRGAVVHQRQQQHHRAHHHGRGPHLRSAAPASATRSASRRAPTATSGSPTPTTRSGASRRPASVTNYPGAGISADSGSRPGPDGNLWFTNHNGDTIGRITPPGVITLQLRRPPPTPRTRSPPARRQPVVHQRDRQSIGRITTTGSVSNHTGAGVYAPVAITTGPDGNLGRQRLTGTRSAR